MIFRVLSLFAGIISGQVPLADNASDPARHGRWDRVSRPSLALCSSLIATRHCADALACEPRREHGAHRTIGSYAGHQGDGDRTAPSYRLAAVSLSSSGDTRRPCAGSSRKTWNGFPERFERRTAQNSASGSRGPQFFQAETPCHTADSDGRSNRPSSSASSGTWPYTSQNTTSPWPSEVETRFRRSRSACEVFP